MSVASPVIQSIDGLNRRIYLKQGVTEFHPIEDIYKEYRNLRRTDENLRKWEPLIRAEGNINKGAGKATPRYLVLISGTKFVPFDENAQLIVTGEAITDNPDVDSDIFDTSGLTQPLKVYYAPSEAEIIFINPNGDDTTPPVWVGAEGISDVYQDGLSLNIRWNGATDESGSVLYKIFISRFLATLFESYNLLTTINGTMLNTRFEDTGGTPFQIGQQYFIGVRAIDEFGNETTNTNYGTVTFQASTSNTDVNIISVNGVSVTSPDDLKGLSASQEAKITDTNTLINSMNTVLNNTKTVVDSLPQLSSIEASTILAKKSDVSTVEAIVNTLPILSEIRNEFINIEYGALEITNDQMIIRDKANVVIAVFNLFDEFGNPTMNSVYKRTVVS